MAQANQQQLLRQADQVRVAAELPDRSSRVARLVRAVSSISFNRRRAELPVTVPVVTDA